MARVYLKGLPELKRKLIKLKSATEEKVAPAVGRAGDDIVAMMKRLVAVDEGKLRDSIGWTFGPAPKGSIKVGTFKAGSLRLTIFAGSEKVFWARFVEFGTRAHTIKAKNAKALGQGGIFGTEVEHPGTAAQPFFYPSWRVMKKPAKRLIAKAVQEAVRSVSRT